MSLRAEGGGFDPIFFRRMLAFGVFVTIIVFFLLMIYRALLFSFLLSLIFAYILAPISERVIRIMKGRRAIAVFLLIFILVVFVAMAIVQIMPVIYSQFLEIVRRLPMATRYLSELSEPIRGFLEEIGIRGVDTRASLFDQLNLFSNLGLRLKDFIEKLWESTPLVLGGVINSAMVPVLLFFILKDLPDIKRIIIALIPHDLLLPILLLQKRIDMRLRSVLMGQLIVAFVLGILYMAGLWLVGLEFGLAIGAVAGVCRIVPYLDVLVGMMLSLIVIMTQYSGVGHVVAVSVVFLAVQIFDGMFLTPRIIGDRVGLNPVVIIVTIIALGGWFGFLGILLAVPVIALVSAAFELLLPVYLKSPFYLSIMSRSSETAD